MTDAHRLGACDKLMVQGLIRRRYAVLKAIVHLAQARKLSPSAQAVDLIEGNPIANPIVVALEQHAAVTKKMLDEPPVGPSVIIGYQAHWHLVMRDGHDRLDAVPPHRVDEPIVEREARLVWLRVVAMGKDARPVKRRAEAREAHLVHEGQILLERMVEVDTVAARIIPLRVVDRSPYLIDRVREAQGPQAAVFFGKDLDIGDRRAFAVFVPRAFGLVRRNGSAPQEILGESRRHRHINGARHHAPPLDPLSFRYSLTMFVTILTSLLMVMRVSCAWVKSSVVFSTSVSMDS